MVVVTSGARGAPVVRLLGSSMASDRLQVERQLAEVEALLESIDPPPRPGHIALVLFTDDDAGQFRTYVDDLAARFPRTPVTTITSLVPRPAGLKPAWTAPRAWLDFEPAWEECTNLRPDVQGALVPRVDWTGPSTPAPSPAVVIADLVREVDQGPGAEHRGRVAKAAARWHERNGAEVLGDLAESPGQSCELADDTEADAPAPLPSETEVLSLNWRNRGPTPDDVRPAGPLGGGT
jgi:hypothetical protein